MLLEPGTALGRYEILGLLGQGGMASVYKARQPALDRVVAIKVLRPSLAEDPEFRERFEREARAAGQLRHPRIVEVFDFDVVDGRYFMAMEHVEGATLKDRLSDLARQQKSPPPREIARIVSEVAEGLAFAHGNGVIHRDVKPSNIMLRTDGRALVADFGIAKMASSTQYTRTGTGIGTPEYMSPEQAQGLQVGPASDIYALAVVAYEIFTGRVPFTAESPLAIALSHIRDQVPTPSAISPLVGPAIEEVLLRGLAKTPEERYATTVEFAAALAVAVVADESTTFATLPRLAEREGSLRPTGSLRGRIRRRRGQLLILAGGLLVTVSIVGLLLATAPTAVPTAATLRVLDGSPELLARGQPRYDVAITGSVVGPGDKLRLLGSARAEMSFFDGSALVLEPGTEVELSRADRSVDGIASIRVQQKVGLTRASVIAPTRFAVETPTALVQAHGTEFVIDVAADGTTGVVVTDSEVRVTAQGRTVAVRSGDRASVKPGRPPEGGTAVVSEPQFPIPVPEIALPRIFESPPSVSPTPTASPPATASATASAVIDGSGIATTIDRFTPGCVAGQASRAEEKRYLLSGFGGQTVKVRLGATSLGFAGDSFAYFDDASIRAVPASGNRPPLNALRTGDDHADCAVGSTPIRGGETVRGDVDTAGDVDFFTLYTESVYFYKIQLRATGFVPRLSVRDSSGSLRSVLTTESGTDTTSLSPTTVPATYVLDVRSQNLRETGTYTRYHQEVCKRRGDYPSRLIENSGPRVGARGEEESPRGQQRYASCHPPGRDVAVA